MTDHIHLLAGAYALDALPLDEQAFFERHLATCDSCRQAVTGYQEAASTLGAAAHRTPPRTLRGTVLAQVAATRQPLARPRGLRDRLRPHLTAVAGIVALALVSLGGLTAALWEPGTGAPEVAIAPSFLAGAESVQLDGPDGVDARFLFSRDTDEGYVVVSGLTSPGAGRDYQLWLFHDGVPVPAGVFEVHDGRATVQVEAPVWAAELIAVTNEPAGGLPIPSGPVVLSSSL